MAAYMVMMEDPPALMKGRVSPTTGNTYRHMPTLTPTWARSIPAYPMAIRALWGEQARRATHTHRRMMHASSSSSTAHPTSPNSSPQTAKISSVYRAGRLGSNWLWVWMPLHQPWPKRPPLPMARILRVCCQPMPWVWL